MIARTRLACWTPLNCLRASSGEFPILPIRGRPSSLAMGRASLLSLPHRFGSSMMGPCHAVALSPRHQICSQRHRLQSLPQPRQARSPRRRRRRSTWPRRCAGICSRRICPTRSSGWMTLNSRRFLWQRSTRRSGAASCRLVWRQVQGRIQHREDRGRGMSLPRCARRTLRFSR